VNFPVDSENEYTLLASVRNVLDEYGNRLVIGDEVLGAVEGCKWR
jgi:hypothetical protein